jgi:hypothetical protein
MNSVIFLLAFFAAVINLLASRAYHEFVLLRLLYSASSALVWWLILLCLLAEFATEIKVVQVAPLTVVVSKP